MLVAPSTTWLLVRISPLDVRTMPVPAAWAFWYCSTVLISTMPTCCAGVAVVAVDPVEVEPSDVGSPEPHGPRPSPGKNPAASEPPCAAEAEPTTDVVDVAWWTPNTVTAARPSEPSVPAATTPLRFRRGGWTSWVGACA